MSRIGHKRIGKKEWYLLGGFANSKLFRKATKRGVWTYWIVWE